MTDDERTRIHTLFNRLKAANPDPTTELQYTSAFQLLVAVILSAQSTDRQVNIVTAKLFAVAPDAQAMATLGEDGIRKLIASLGLYNSKARNLAATAHELAANHNGNVPPDFETLVKLPGVGRKTANVVLNTLYNQPRIAVDTHIFRVANRLGLTHARSVEDSEQQLMRVVPEPFLLNAHHWLILHGRYTCTARKPRCADCLLVDLCPSRVPSAPVNDQSG